MHKVYLRKPDGRNLYLYSREPINDQIVATSPKQDPVRVLGAHLRWHPFRGEWVAYSGHRQNRTFLPAADKNPLAQTTSLSDPTELPAGGYDVAVFDNMFPTLKYDAPAAPQLGAIETSKAIGVCEVVVFTRDPHTSLGALETEHVALIIEVWGERYLEIGSLREIKYVMAFENRGKEVGVTLHHPHGQIYAYPFVPPVPAREQIQIEEYYRKQGRPLLLDRIHGELQSKERILFHDEHAIAFVPPWARYPYEVWVAPMRSAKSFAELNQKERYSLARALKTVLMKYDGLWQRPFPYLMLIHQAPTDGREHAEYHAYIELCPAYRSSDKLKFLAGTELGAGMFANDSIPEQKAGELRAIEVRL